MANKPILVAVPVESVAAYTPIPPSVKRAACGGCGKPIYLSDSSRRMVQAGSVVAVCPRCATGQLKGKPVLPMLAPGAEEDLRAMGEWRKGD